MITRTPASPPESLVLVGRENGYTSGWSERTQDEEKGGERAPVAASSRITTTLHAVLCAELQASRRCGVAGRRAVCLIG